MPFDKLRAHWSCPELVEGHIEGQQKSQVTPPGQNLQSQKLIQFSIVFHIHHATRFFGRDVEDRADFARE